MRYHDITNTLILLIIYTYNFIKYTFNGIIIYGNA